ncbi:MAG: amidohydrolase family protein [Actinomycetota bacterium]
MDPTAPDALDRLETAAQQGMAGLRIGCDNSPGWLGPSVTTFWSRLTELHWPICLTAKTDQLHLVAEISRRVPTLSIVVEHLGAGTPTWGIPASSLAALAELASSPRVYLKITTVNLGCLSADPGDERRFEQLLEMFGASRMMWGSNFPASDDVSYASAIRFARDRFPGSLEQQALFLGGTAMSVWPDLQKLVAAPDANFASPPLSTSQ